MTQVRSLVLGIIVFASIVIGANLIINYQASIDVTFFENCQNYCNGSVTDADGELICSCNGTDLIVCENPLDKTFMLDKDRTYCWCSHDVYCARKWFKPKVICIADYLEN